jgi:ABC-2 type transport system permease protein
MVADIFTIVWKEVRELLVQKPNLRGGWLGMMVFIGVFGILLPLQTGRAWVESPIGLLYWIWVPFILVSTVIADSFAGERERHTLETLLASRLSDKSILLGKIAAAICYGWGFTLLSLLLGLISVNLVHGQGELLLYPPVIGFSILAASFLMTAFASTLGVLVSLRAPTVRSAQQTLGSAAILPLLLIIIIPMLPESMTRGVMAWFMGKDIESIMLPVVALFLALDLFLLLAASRRFRRALLILD